MGGVNHVAWVKGKGRLPALLRAVMWQQKSFQGPLVARRPGMPSCWAYRDDGDDVTQASSKLIYLVKYGNSDYHSSRHLGPGAKGWAKFPLWWTDYCYHHLIAVAGPHAPTSAVSCSTATSAVNWISFPSLPRVLERLVPARLVSRARITRK
ncbi:uncharacterized protein BO96DRAFT_489948 [Aspergillus niger CBS 101883]|uniref:Uncharacterized protein n=2 Tax=Aspergillus niger TaxID=5061 RepID=A2Q8I9_ASPNC|nr:uncharacterized protein BO96DRAFT_489948 [Aspergillus niger CBS 101883]XP_059599633.1 hypothetical protein An01g04500 [Aspergillus niger]PYH50792.1 hypothetical protein BO96DRAFT_489948 [Aspergillus niger CBS 101883]CAK36986.1 hypothetical protein An01g04500 [Aspergillus niger]